MHMHTSTQNQKYTRTHTHTPACKHLFSLFPLSVSHVGSCISSGASDCCHGVKHPCNPGGLNQLSVCIYNPTAIQPAALYRCYSVLSTDRGYRKKQEAERQTHADLLIADGVQMDGGETKKQKQKKNPRSGESYLSKCVPMRLWTPARLFLKTSHLRHKLFSKFPCLVSSWRTSGELALHKTNG